MEAFITDINEQIHAVVWGPIMLLLMIGVGLYFTVRCGFFQIFRIKEVFKEVFQRKVQTGEMTGSISSFQAAATSLGGCLGTGNIVGVATTLVVGGPGALFWMWVSAFVGMMTKYAEIVLAVRYRTRNHRGDPIGGPMYYIEKGMGLKWLGVLFAVFATLASFGIGNMTQINAITNSFTQFQGVNRLMIGVGVAVLVAFVILGGIKRIAQVNAVLIPVFAMVYTIGALIILWVYAPRIPEALSLIVSDALNLQAVSGGMLGYVMTKAIRFGVARGVFSNEAGLGSASFAHAASKNQDAVKEGLWGIFEVFFDTIVMCTLTGLVILTSGVLSSGADGAVLTTKAFGTVFGELFSGIFLTISIAFFAFATLIGWSYYGEKCVEYLFRTPHAVRWYKIIFTLCVVVGATMELQLVWNISDTLNGAMALPNLIALLGLSPVVIKLTKEYVKQNKGEKKR